MHHRGYYNDWKLYKQFINNNLNQFNLCLKDNPKGYTH